MKRIFTTALVLMGFAVYAQDAPKQAIIKTKTTIVSPEDDNNAPPPPPPGEGGERRMVFMAGGDMEFNTTTYIKNSMNKTVLKSDMFNTTTIRDNANKKTITLSEMMGKKTATIATDEEAAEMQKRLDSMMQANPQLSGANRNNTPPTYEVVNIEETKKIAGYDCKKAILITIRGMGRRDSTTVWYCPTLKFEGLNLTGGGMPGGGGGIFVRNMGLGGLEKIDGFPMLYERNMNRGRKMTVEVTSIDTNKEIKDAEFEIPKGYEIQSAKDAQRGFGSMQLRIGG